eukprot:jgi/Psemu1/292406/fgenesh1_pg.1040_\
MEKERWSAAVNAQLNPMYPDVMRKTSRQVLLNDMTSVKYIILCQNGIQRFGKKGSLDEVMQEAPGKSVFTAGVQDQPAKFNQSSNTPTGIIRPWEPGTCFNCGSRDHRVAKCPKEKDQDQINCDRSLLPGPTSGTLQKL